MKNYAIILITLLGLIFFSGCGEEDIETPTPSTNASFTYETKRIDGNSVEVHFINNSTEAKDYFWEFGLNNETSTEYEPTFLYDDTIGAFKAKLTCTPKNKELYYNVAQDSTIVNTAPYIWEVRFDDGKMPEGTELFNLDGATPSNSSIASLADSAWIVAYRPETANYHGGYAALGVSYYDPPAVADDWMIFDAVELPNTDVIELSWLATSLTTSGNYPDHYEVGISTTEQTYEACSENIVLSVEDEEIVWTERKVDLKQFAGQTIYIGFHLNTPYDTGDRLAIDDIAISAYDLN